MALLPTLEEHHEAVAASRLIFLKNFVDRAGDLVASLSPASDRSLPVEAALTEAAALAFATNRTQIGKALLLRILSASETGQPSSLRQLTVIAIMRSQVVNLWPDGVMVNGILDGAARFWSAPGSVIQTSAGTLLASALASEGGRMSEKLSLLSRSAKVSDTGRLAQLTIATCAEAAALPLLGLSLDDDGFLGDVGVNEQEKDAAFASFLALHNRYASSMRLNRADRYRWNHLRCRAPLIDWPLLMLHLALRRHRSYRYAIDEGRSDLAGRLSIFLWNLAGEIDDTTSGGGRGGPDGGFSPPARDWSTEQYQARPMKYQTQSTR